MENHDFLLGKTHLISMAMFNSHVVHIPSTMRWIFHIGDIPIKWFVEYTQIILKTTSLQALESCFCWMESSQNCFFVFRRVDDYRLPRDAHTFEWLYVSIFIHVYIHIYIYILHVYIYIHMYIYIYISYICISIIWVMQRFQCLCLDSHGTDVSMIIPINSFKKILCNILYIYIYSR